MSDHRRQPPLSRSEIKSLFQNIEYTDELSPTAHDPLTSLPPRERSFVEHWVEIVSRTNEEVAKLFAAHAPEALAEMDFDGVEAWLLRALEAFDQRGLGWAVDVLKNPATFAAARAAAARRIALSDIEPLLNRLVTGLGGRELRIAAADTAYTDTETLYLPATLTGDSREATFRHYKALAVHHWAQTYYGTWQVAVLGRLLTLPRVAEAFEIYSALERLRLDACIARDLPGVARDMRALSPEPALTGAWQAAAQALADPAATAMDSCAWIARVTEPPPAPAPYHGVFRPSAVKAVLDARIERERAQLSKLLEKLRAELAERTDNTTPDPNPAPRNRKPTEGFSLSARPGEPSSAPLELRMGERKIPLSDEVQNLLGSIAQDLGEIPDEYLHGSGKARYDADYAAPPPTFTPAVISDSGLRYPEWDYTRQRFRPNYCTVREHTVTPGDPDFVPRTLVKYRGLVKTIRRSFEALLGEERLERRQPGGDDIDLDALVKARADVLSGEEMSEGVYLRRRDNTRSIAVMVMVDMSGSTKGWVNEAEREALVLLSAALETSGDWYAIYGFSGRTQQRVDIYHVKRFAERYDERIRARISGISPQSYTRMGAPIRHLGALLQQVQARHKLLITLSDGKPEDYGSYYGRYGIEDTRHALLELRRDGVHPFCITIDREGGDYLPYMYGAANYACIDEVRKLPLKVAEIYRRLTRR